MGNLSLGNWIAIVALVISAIGVVIAFANYLPALRERQHAARQRKPQIKATINAKYYDDGWRSVQLHVVPAEETRQSFEYEAWRIERASLLQPKTAELARAENDDYATGVFYRENPVRKLEGKPDGHAQRFALEFFIRFLAGEGANKATFRVTFSRISGRERRTVVVAASLPPDAEQGRGGPGEEAVPG